MAGRARPAGSFAVALARAREAWDGLTGGPNVEHGPDIEPGHVMALGPDDRPPVRLVYSEVAAAAIIDAALRLWPDSAATMGEDPPED